MHRVIVTGYDQDEQSVGDFFTVEASDEHEACAEARLAAEDCGWTVDSVDYIGMAA